MAMEMLQRLLAVLDEPALLVGACGTVRLANAPALRLLGRPEGEVAGRSLQELAADPPEAVRTLLRRCAGSRTAVIGSLALSTADGATHSCRCRGGRLGEPDDPAAPLLLLRLEEGTRDRSQVLTRTIVALNAEIRRSKLAQDALEAALEQKGMLLRELHHRVKNNLQVLLGILLLGEQQAKAPEALAAIHDARLRVEAMALLQRLFYGKDRLERIEAATFLAEVARGVERAFRRPEVELRVLPTSATLPLDLASSLGLVLNELLTNAFKHAFPDGGTGAVTVGLALEPDPAGGERFTLTVEDDGRGTDAAPDAGTGLMLVRGLAQQHGGAFTIEAAAPGRSTRCTVTLRHRPRAPC
jgi:two-component sensor histidine kinase